MTDGDMTPGIRSAWLRTFAHATVVLVSGLGIGLLIDQPWPALALAALGMLAWHCWTLHGVLMRMDARQRPQPPANGGAWHELDRLLLRGQTDMRARKRRLLAMLRAYRAAAAALPDAVVVIERNRQRVLWFNEAATPLLGLQHPQHIDASVVGALQPLPMASWLAAGRNAEPMTDVPSPVEPARRLSLRLIPYSDELWLLVARDVTKLMRLEHMRRDFVANVSHELRTPLTVIHGYLEMLDPEEQPDWAPMLAEMQRQSQRMTQLVEDLLTLSRLEARDTLPEEHIAMAPMLATLRREAEALSGGLHQVRVHENADIDLWGSSQELHSAFSNLVSNAVRYTPAGGEITIDFTMEPGGGAVLSVRDTGYGIPEAHLPRITERFYRVSTSRSRESGGTGLGLAIAKHILSLHGGRLEVASEVGQGSTFSCHFDSTRVQPRNASRYPEATP